MQKVRQVSFAAGEWAPELHRRSDLQRHGSASKTMLNFFVSQFGVPVSRPGTRHLDLLESTSGGTGLLWSFVATDESVWLLVVTGGVTYTAGGYTFRTGGHIRPARLDADGDLEWSNAIDNPWDYADLAELGHSQTGDVLRITHPEFQPRTFSLSKSGDVYTWELEELDFDLEEFDLGYGTPRIRTGYSLGTTEWTYKVTRVMERADGTVYETAAFDVIEVGYPHALVWNAEDTFLQNQKVWLDGDDDYIYTARHTNTNQEPSTEGDTTYWERAAAGDAEVLNYDNVANKALCDGYKFAPSEANPIRIWWDEDFPWDDLEHGTDTVLATRVYRGVEDYFGYVGQTKTSEFYDLGETPLWSHPPPGGTDPFTTFTFEGQQIEGSSSNYPRVSTYHEGRVIYAGGSTSPSEIVGSAIDNFNDFDMVVPANDADSYRFALAGRFVEDIRAVLARQQLIVLTRTTEWVVGGSGQSEVITPNSIAARPLSRWGCGLLPPLEANGHVWFMEAKKTTPRVILFGTEGRIEGVRDVSQEWRHLFTGHTIESWTYAEDPYSLVWAVRDDGVLLSCTFQPLENMIAWSRHEVANATVVAVEAVPNGLEDVVYMLVRIGSSASLHLERLTTRVIDSVEEAVCLDHSATYDGRNTDDDVTVQFDSVDGGLSIYSDVDVTIVGEDAAGENVNKRIRIWDETAGIQADALLQSHDGGGVYTAQLQSYLNRQLRATPYATWAVLTNEIPGLEHIAGQAAYALADGNVVGPHKITGGAFHLLEWAAVAHAGLKYNCDLVPMDMTQERGKQKVVRAVVIEARGARGGSVGPDLDNLTSLPARTVEDGYSTLELEDFERRALVKGGHDTAGAVAFRQSDPLPVAILGITREVEVGGD